MSQNVPQKSALMKLSPAKRRAIAALLFEKTLQDAAQAAGVSRKTLQRWSRQPDFIAAMKETERAALADVSRALIRLAGLASSALEDALQDEDIRIRVRAADIVLSRLLQLRELVDLDERVSKLEEIL